MKSSFKSNEPVIGSADTSRKAAWATPELVKLMSNNTQGKDEFAPTEGSRTTPPAATVVEFARS